MDKQIILDSYEDLRIFALKYDHVVVVHGKSFLQLEVYHEFMESISDVIIKDILIDVPVLNDSLLNQFARFIQDDICVIAIGGGHIIDAAKLIVHAAIDTGIVKHIPTIVAIPTTCGSGSESTHFAVFYDQKTEQKNSIGFDYLLPKALLFDCRVLRTLPTHQKVSAILDAICQCIESYWAKGHTDESRSYAVEGLKILAHHLDAIVQDSYDDDIYKDLLRASNLSGKAINISKTTAAHALSYWMTFHAGIDHGVAVANMMLAVYCHMKQVDPIVCKELEEICGMDPFSLVRTILVAHDLLLAFDSINVSTVFSSVNVQRMSNHPYSFGIDDFTAFRGVYL